MTTPEPRRSSTTSSVDAAVRAIQPVLAETPPFQLADLAAILGQVRGRAIHLTNMSLLKLPGQQIVTAVWTRAPARDYLFHDDRMAGTNYHHDVVLHMLSHIYLGHVAPLRIGADAVLGELFDSGGRAMLCQAGVRAHAEVPVPSDTQAEAEADTLASWLADIACLPGDAERRRIAMSNFLSENPRPMRRLDSGRWLQVLTSAPGTGGAT